MHPAGSVILFTTSTGFGYGLLIWLSIALLFFDVAQAVGLVAIALAAICITIGLLSSTWHLGHPERAWRAISQWRSSWLSREGLMAIITYLPMLLLFLAVWQEQTHYLVFLALISSGCAIMTIHTTAMIYASLRPIPAWSNGWTVIGYQTNALASGGVLFVAIQALIAQPNNITTITVIGALLLAWFVKHCYWRHIHTSRPLTNAQTAIGLRGNITLLDPPHSAPNYLMKEMGFVLARRHATFLRRLTYAGFGATFFLLLPQYLPTTLAAVVLLSMTIVSERYLFFSEAKHVVMQYYRPHN